MEKTFNSKDYINELSEELVNAFKKAGKATTPVGVGSAREKAVRDKLEKIFTQTIGISTGCIIDSFGNTSKQTDIILYEKDICPVFSINDTPETTYYPCEGVIAVGEIKSTLDTKDLEDSFRKIESVKQSRRFSNDNTCWRKYCSRQSIQGADTEAFNQSANPLDQIYGFILCEKIGLKIDTLLQKCADLIKGKEAHLLPNIIVSLNEGLIVYLDSVKNVILFDRNNADMLTCVNTQNGNFQYLLQNLNNYICYGRSTIPIPFDKYIIGTGDITITHGVKLL